MMKTTLIERRRWRVQAAALFHVTVDAGRMNAVLDDLETIGEPEETDPFCPMHGRASRPARIEGRNGQQVVLQCAGFRHCQAAT